MRSIETGSTKSNAWKIRRKRMATQVDDLQSRQVHSTYNMARFAIQISVVALVSALVATGFALIVFIDRLW